MLASASCLNLQRTHTIPAFILLLSWKSKGRTRLTDFYLESGYQELAAWEFFFLVLCYKISDRFIQVGAFLLHCLTEKYS